MVRKIIKYPSPSLRKPCRKVSFPLTQEVLDHIQDLKDTLATIPHGLALSSNQILPDGFQIFVTKPGNGLPEVAINPSWQKGVGVLVSWIESCLSVPELTLTIPRYDSIHFDWDEGETSMASTDVRDVAAQIVQHECEHLNGKLITDYLTHKQLVRFRSNVIRNRKAGK